MAVTRQYSGLSASTARSTGGTAAATAKMSPGVVKLMIAGSSRSQATTGGADRDGENSHQ